MKYRAWGQESILISVIVGVYFSHFFIRFSRVLALVRINGVSVIVRCLQGENRRLQSFSVVMDSFQG